MYPSWNVGWEGTVRSQVHLAHSFLLGEREGLISATQHYSPERRHGLRVYGEARGGALMLLLPSLLHRRFRFRGRKSTTSKLLHFLSLSHKHVRQYNPRGVHSGDGASSALSVESVLTISWNVDSTCLSSLSIRWRCSSICSSMSFIASLTRS